MLRRPTITGIAMALLAATYLSACGGGEPTGTTATVARVDVSPQTVTLAALGDTRDFNAVAKDANGNTISGQTFTWSSSATGVATVSASGMATAVGNGSTTISATTAGVSGSASLTVSQVAATVDVTPGTDTLTAVGDTLRFSAVAKDAGGNAISGQTFTWSSSATGVATVTNSGLATAVGNGAAMIIATTAGLSGSAPLTVSQVPMVINVTPGKAALTLIGDTLRFSGAAWDANGNQIAGQAFTWTSTAAAVATADATGLVTAWGLGRTTVTASSGAVSGEAVLSVQASLVSVSAGREHSCGVTTSGVAYCWGGNSGGQLGDGTTSDRTTPVVVSGGLSFATLSADGSHTCGLSAGAAYCWGRNGAGQLGDGTTTDRTAPVAVVGGLIFGSANAGAGHTCGVTTGGEAYCWGGNRVGELGDGTQTDRTTPVPVVGGLSFTGVSADGGHSCGVTTGGVAYCWGSNLWGQLGDGTTTDRTAPVAVLGGLSFSVLRGSWHTCGVTAGGAAYCWGNNGAGQLGDGTQMDRTTPVEVLGGLSFAGVNAGWSHTCGVTTGGEAYCWGRNAEGQLGDHTAKVFQPTPVGVAGGLSFAGVSAGTEHTCGVTTGGVAYCWGDNTWGQLGDGSSNGSFVPVPVLLP